MMHAPVVSPRQRGLFLALAAAIVALLFYLGAQPFAVGLFPEPWDKLAHFAAYGVIALLLCLGIVSSRPLLPIVMVGAIGIADEWRQAYLPGRSADLADLLTDIAASLFVVAFFEFLRARGAAGDVGFGAHHS